MSGLLPELRRADPDCERDVLLQHLLQLGYDLLDRAPTVLVLALEVLKVRLVLYDVVILDRELR